MDPNLERCHCSIVHYIRTIVTKNLPYDFSSSCTMLEPVHDSVRNERYGGTCPTDSIMIMDRYSLGTLDTSNHYMLSDISHATEITISNGLSCTTYMCGRTNLHISDPRTNRAFEIDA